MSLLQDWRNKAYAQLKDPEARNAQKALWDVYFAYEKGIYEQLLSDPDTEVKGTVKELAERYNVPLEFMVGFLDGIDDSLKVQNPIEEMDEDTEVSLAFDKEALYKNMVDAKADWLYNLPMWNDIYDEEKRNELYREAKRMHTIVKPQKIGRNDPCPCGSGKKFKQCHGKGGKNYYEPEE